MKNLYFICFLFFVVVSINLNESFANDKVNTPSFLKQIKIPQTTQISKSQKAIVIAIVDDGIRTSHQDIKPFIWKNIDENPENGMDDDGNGVVNDVYGWDVADKNNDISPPINTRFDFYHGTHLASIITKITRAVYQDNAPNNIKIMAVKSLRNDAETPYIKHGYEGIEYALNTGADIILTAWGVGHISPHESKILQLAEKKGVLIVAAGGNLANNKKQFPAAAPNVFSVAAIDSNYKKIKLSSYGSFIDISAPGKDINGASFESDNDYETYTGTSQASAIVAAISAIVKLQNPSFSWNQIKACIKNSADPIHTHNSNFISKLGAGSINLAKAIQCNIFTSTTRENTLVNPQGYLRLLKNNENNKTWKINPVGTFKGIRFKKVLPFGNNKNTILHVYKGPINDSSPYLQYSLDALPEEFFLPGTTATLVLTGDNTNNHNLLEYKSEPIDFTQLYCNKTKYYKKEGIIEDGSGDNNYSYNSSCKWLITAPEGKVIRFNFTELDTESKVDKIYFFNGDKTNADVMAIISGNRLPPKFKTWGNKVLVWFVTDDKNQGNGWKLNYSFIDM